MTDSIEEQRIPEFQNRQEIAEWSEKMTFWTILRNSGKFRRTK